MWGVLSPFRFSEIAEPKIVVTLKAPRLLICSIDSSESFPPFSAKGGSGAVVLRPLPVVWVVDINHHGLYDAGAMNTATYGERSPD